MKKHLLAGLGTALGLLFLNGCAEVAMTEFIPQTLDFFTANGWVDKDNDGLIDRDEFEGTKSSFSSRESITFVGIFYKSVGNYGSRRLFSPGGQVIDEGKFTVSSGTYFERVPYKVKDLLDKGGSGRWRMEWYMEGVLINTTYARLLP